MAADDPADRILAQLYDWEHDDFREDVALYKAFALRTGGPVLELACGSGRVLEALAEDGLAVAGLDRSGAMLARARARLARFGQRVTLVEGDINRDVPPGDFSLILAPLDGFGLAAQTDMQITLLRRAASALSRGGLLVLDLVSPGFLEGQPQEVPILQRSGYCAEIDAHVAKWVVRRVSAASESIELVCFYDVTSPGHELRRYEHVVRFRFFSRYEIELLLSAGGLTLTAVYGGYELEPFSDTSERLIVIAGRDGADPAPESGDRIRRKGKA